MNKAFQIARFFILGAQVVCPIAAVVVWISLGWFLWKGDTARATLDGVLFLILIQAPKLKS